MHIIGKHEGKIFDERDVDFNIGEGEDVNIPEGVELGLLRFGLHETSRLIIKPRYAFGAVGCKDLNVPENATVEYTVTLNDFERYVESWELSQDQRLVQAQLVKDKGTAYFKSGKFQLALKLYERSNSCLEKGGNFIIVTIFPKL